MTFENLRKTMPLFAALLLAACGGSGGSNDPITSEVSACNPSDAATASACGTVLIGLTDADGDFLNYSVNVTQLTLETANGRVVEVLPRQTRVNFTDYVDLTELVTAATVPPAIYVAGSITLDYTDAEVFVEAGDASKPTIVTDLDGIPLEQVELKIKLSNRDRLAITRGRAALLQLDFDLEASHDVDIEPTPATAAADHLILAEVHPVDEKDIRVRGPLLAVNEADMNYVIAVRPFHDREGDFGRVTVHVANDTEFEVDGAVFAGVDGLRALDAAGRGTPTIAKGTLHVDDRRFTAMRVLAGSSVPGSDLDAVVGNIIERDGNFLTVRGATIIPRENLSDRPVHYHDDVLVEVGPNTRVFKDGDRLSDLSIDALSIGQRVTIRGSQPVATNDADAPQVLFDATDGAVRMHITHLAGTVNTSMPGQTDITLHAIDRRRAAVFNFAGTGPTADQDATPDNYEIATGDLALTDFITGHPIVAYGFPTAFGMAPPDFTGRTMIDYVDVRSSLGIAWGESGTVAPFASIGSDGIVLALDNPDIGIRHHVKQGPVLIDLLELGSNTVIIPRETDRMLFSIKSGDSSRQYSDFDDFVADLTTSLNGSTTARSMFARGKFDAATNTITAYKIGVFLIDPPM